MTIHLERRERQASLQALCLEGPCWQGQGSYLSAQHPCILHLHTQSLQSSWKGGQALKWPSPNPAAAAAPLPPPPATMWRCGPSVGEEISLLHRLLALTTVTSKAPYSSSGDADQSASTSGQPTASEWQRFVGGKHTVIARIARDCPNGLNSMPYSDQAGSAMHATNAGATGCTPSSGSVGWRQTAQCLQHINAAARLPAAFPATIKFGCHQVDWTRPARRLCRPQHDHFQACCSNPALALLNSCCRLPRLHTAARPVTRRPPLLPGLQVTNLEPACLVPLLIEASPCSWTARQEPQVSAAGSPSLGAAAATAATAAIARCAGGGHPHSTFSSL